MELEQLRIFLAVAGEKSFSRGAKKLYISHSTTSRAVSALEEELGVTLLRRGNRVLGLTPAGERLCEEARLLLEQAERSAQRVRDCPQSRFAAKSRTAVFCGRSVKSLLFAKPKPNRPVGRFGFGIGPND